MRKLKYVKLFESFQVNEGIFDIFKSKERIESENSPVAEEENSPQDLLKDLTNPDKFDIVKVGSPEYKSFNDIKEGDLFIGHECVELLEMGKKDIALREWKVVQVEVIMRDTIKFKYIYLGGTEYTSRSFGDARTSSDKKFHFSNKIVMK
jgi:hypothetical protein